MKGNLKEKVVIKAVYDDDLPLFLRKIGLWEEMEKEELKCSICDCVLNLNNFGGVFRENNKIKAFCQNTQCYLEVLKRKTV